MEIPLVKFKGFRISEPFYLVVFLLFCLHIVLGFLIPPLLTSDFHRNLFYGQAFWKYGFKVYDMTPLEIDPNYDIIDPPSGLLACPAMSPFCD